MHLLIHANAFSNKSGLGSANDFKILHPIPTHGAFPTPPSNSLTPAEFHTIQLS